MTNPYRLLYMLAAAGIVLVSQQPFAGEAGGVLLMFGIALAGAAFPDRLLPGLKK